jgi:general secretion pathway protein F
LLRHALQNGATRLREGSSISEVFAAMPILPATTGILIAVGERTGQMGAAMLQAARLLEADTQARIDRWLAIANPAAVVVLGGVIAFLIAGLMLGILSISQLALK